MGFKLGKATAVEFDSGMVKQKLSFGSSGKDSQIPGNPIEYVAMPEMGVADIDGTIYMNEELIPGTSLHDEVLNHEMKHMTDLKTGKLSYSENAVYYDGESYPRSEDGLMVQVKGKWYETGDAKNLPWENH